MRSLWAVVLRSDRHLLSSHSHTNKAQDFISIYNVNIEQNLSFKPESCPVEFCPLTSKESCIQGMNEAVYLKKKTKKQRRSKAVAIRMFSSPRCENTQATLD